MVGNEELPNRGTMAPPVRVGAMASERAAPLVTWPSRSTAAMICMRVVGRIISGLDNARDTVPGDTPASMATSASETARPAFSGQGEGGRSGMTRHGGLVSGRQAASIVMQAQARSLLRMTCWGYPHFMGRSQK